MVGLSWNIVIKHIIMENEAIEKKLKHQKNTWFLIIIYDKCGVNKYFFSKPTQLRVIRAEILRVIGHGFNSTITQFIYL